MDLLNQKRIILYSVLLAGLLIVCFLLFKLEVRIERQSLRAPEVLTTIPEGSNVSAIANILGSKLPNFNKNNFLLLAENKEGYLFPDTYYFFLSDDGTHAIQTMSDNFNKKITPLMGAIQASGKTENQIIVMASIIEGEASKEGDRGIISGILWKRIADGMPLQVDDAPETYKAQGLPEEPINNPGMSAILAALYPKSSPYLYYLYDKNGMIHYATTFAEHKQNEAKYLQ